MATIEVKTSETERKNVIAAVKEIGEQVAPVSKIAQLAHMPESRARYALIDCVDKGLLERIPHKAFNKHYVRYSYRVVNKEAK